MRRWSGTARPQRHAKTRLGQPPRHALDMKKAPADRLASAWNEAHRAAFLWHLGEDPRSGVGKPWHQSTQKVVSLSRNGLGKSSKTQDASSSSFRFLASASRSSSSNLPSRHHDLRRHETLDSGALVSSRRLGCGLSFFTSKIFSTLFFSVAPVRILQGDLRHRRRGSRLFNRRRRLCLSYRLKPGRYCKSMTHDNNLWAYGRGEET